MPSLVGIPGQRYGWRGALVLPAEYFAQQEDPGGVTVSASITETADNPAAQSAVTVLASAAITEAAGTVSASSGAVVSVISAVTETANTVSVAAGVALVSVVSITELPDTMSAVSAVKVTADTELTDISDTVTADIAVERQAVSVDASLTELPDSLSASAHIGNPVTYDKLTAAQVDGSGARLIDESYTCGQVAAPVTADDSAQHLTAVTGLTLTNLEVA